LASLSSIELAEPNTGAPMHAHEMISSHPNVNGDPNDALIACVEECYACAQACTSCADSCVGEDTSPNLTQCIRLNLDCADVCAATGALASRRSGANGQTLRMMLEACAAACRICGEECHRHASHHEHCRLCAQICLRCAQACDQARRTFA